MFKVIMYDGGVYRSDELYEMIEDVGGVVIQKTKSAQMLTVIMSIPEEDSAMIEALCIDIGGVVKPVPLAGTEIAVVGPTLGRHHMPHPICDIAEELRRYGAITVVMGLARGRGKATAQISLEERLIIEEYDAAVFSLGNFKECIEAKKDLFKDVRIPVVLVSGPQTEGLEGYCDAMVSGVGRKASRMRTASERAKLDEIADRVEDVLKQKKKLMEEDPLFVNPGEIKVLLEDYEPINMCLRPAPIVLHMDGLRLKVSYEEHAKIIGEMEVYGRKLSDVCKITPSKIDDSSIIMRIKTLSEIEYEDSRKK
ncbi:MAG: methanogenesis marker 7 protein [Candidatus Methanogranum gryphiswaldense]|nr:MAG: methanogenesis marker 7 protein [Candidatus Methanogranum sp. U3.2.1]